MQCMHTARQISTVCLSCWSGPFPSSQEPGPRSQMAIANPKPGKWAASSSFHPLLPIYFAGCFADVEEAINAARFLGILQGPAFEFMSTQVVYREFDVDQNEGRLVTSIVFEKSKVVGSSQRKLAGMG